MMGRLLATVLLAAFAGALPAADIEFVTIGDPGNTTDQPLEFRRPFGAVDYVFQVSKYEITNVQYAEFLNAVAADDPGRLYDQATMGYESPRWGRITLDGVSASLEPTARHRLYLLDRKEWIPAEEIRVGEHLETDRGSALVESVAMLPGAHRVYNLEVETDHCYFVGGAHVLVHNENPCAYTPPLAPKETKTDRLKKHVLNGEMDAARREAAGEVVARKADGTHWIMLPNFAMPKMVC